MAAFPTNSLLQLTAFHALVVLLRPLSWNEGYAADNGGGGATRGFVRGGGGGGRDDDSSAARPFGVCEGAKGRVDDDDDADDRTDGVVVVPSPVPLPTAAAAALLPDASHEPQWEENGVRVMLDALRRYSSDKYLQAMGCWAMVNAALYPTLKTSLLRLGGVYAVTNAMMLHPNVEAVQFRGLFALINLVIPGEFAGAGCVRTYLVRLSLDVHYFMYFTISLPPSDSHTLSI